MTGRADQTEHVLALLRQAAGPCSEASIPDAAEIDWKRPCRYSLQQLQRLNRFVQELAPKASSSVAALLGCPQTLLPLEVSQHYAADLPTLAAGYHVVLAKADGTLDGLLSLSCEIAQTWVGKLLGTGQAAAAEDLAGLETSLLLDVAERLVQPIGAMLTEAGSESLQAKAPVARQWSTEINQIEEFCRLAFRLEAEQKEPALSVVLRSALLDPVAQAQGGAIAKKPSSDSRRFLLEHIQEVAIQGLVWLGTGAVSVKDIVALEVGDIVLLRRAVDEPVDFVVQGRNVLQGRLAQTEEGRYALQVLAAGAEMEKRQEAVGSEQSGTAFVGQTAARGK
jgi:flagellar motor switch protein FliM